jgi:LacI family transcriptional regulator
MRYANAQRRWLIHDQLRHTVEEPALWPKCDGAIVAGVSREFFEHVRRFSRYVVHCSGSGDPKVTPVVCLDDFAAGEMAAEHLVECRLERFAFYGDSIRIISLARQRGFAEALSRHGHSCLTTPVAVPTGDEFNSRPHWPELIKWLRTVPKPIGIMAADDGSAHDLAAACFKANVAVPEHVAIIGVNNDDLACESAWPPLSSVDGDYTSVGYRAAEILDWLLSGKKLRPEQRLVRLAPLRVVQRQSTDILAVDDPDVADALRYIRAHACDPCSVIGVLRNVPVSRRWLERQFVRKIGRTPHDEIMRVQIETGKRMLLQPGLTISTVAERCGFSSCSNFGRAFLHVTGVTPGRFRRSVARQT